MDKPHWFPFFTNDFLASSKIAVMTTEEIGAYVLLLCHAWNDPGCSLPDDDQILTRLGRFSGDISKIRACFSVKNDRLVNERLLKEWKKYQKLHEVRSLSGKKANAIRWGSQTDSKNIPTESYLQSQSQSHKEEEKTPVRLVQKPTRTAIPDDEWLRGLKANPIYVGIDIDCQFKKAQAWLQGKPRRIFSRKFFGNWLVNCIGDKPIQLPAKKERIPV